MTTSAHPNEAMRRGNVGEVVLQVEELTVAYPRGGGWVSVVENVSFDVRDGDTVGLVGESGSGKTVTMHTILGIVQRHGGKVIGGRIVFEGRDLLDPRNRDDVLGSQIGFVSQHPARSLDPNYSVGQQIAETYERHRRSSRRAAWARAVEMLDAVGIKDSAERAHDYPHMFSGGMCQRVMIAMALVCEPHLLVADEPTTSLDVTVQARILALLREMQLRFGVAILFVSHDLAVIAELCHRLVVLYAGQVVESGRVVDLFLRPRHPYLEALIHALPGTTRTERLASIPGSVPAPGHFPLGCRFAPRCGFAQDRCRQAEPPLVASAAGAVRCIRKAELALDGVLPSSTEERSPLVSRLV